MSCTDKPTDWLFVCVIFGLLAVAVAIIVFGMVIPTWDDRPIFTRKPKTKQM